MTSRQPLDTRTEVGQKPDLAALKSSGRSKTVFENEAARDRDDVWNWSPQGFRQQVKEVSEFVPLSPGRRDLDSKYTLESLILAQNERWRRA